MPGKSQISKELRQRVYDLNQKDYTVRQILETLQAEDIKISDSTIRRLIKKNDADKAENISFVSCISVEQDPFADDNEDLLNVPILERRIAETKEEETKETKEKEKEETKADIMDQVQSAIKEGCQDTLSQINKMMTEKIEEKNDKLDEMIRETKKKCKPVPINKISAVNVFNTDGLTDQEKIFRRDLIIKIRNYVDLFSDNEIIQSLCGNPLQFKQSLYEKDIKTLDLIYEEIQTGLNQSKDYENFMYMFSSTLKSTEFVSNILLGINITGMKDDILNEIDEFDLKQLACELSVSRYISPKYRLMLITLKVLLKKVLSNDSLTHNKLKLTLAGYYQSINKFLKR